MPIRDVVKVLSIFAQVVPPLVLTCQIIVTNPFPPFALEVNVTVPKLEHPVIVCDGILSGLIGAPT